MNGVNLAMPPVNQSNLNEVQLTNKGPQTLFESPALKLVYEKGNDATVWISFGAAQYGLAFGQSYISKRGDSAFYFIPSVAHWYQTPDIWEALRIARAKLNRSGRIIAYGSSMGGFAAIAFAKEIDPDLIIAAAPQCSICPTVVGAFDRRWADVAQRTEFVRKDAREKLPRNANVVFIYDPLHHEDRLNVKLLADALDQPKFIAAPLGGHGVLHALLDLGLLKGLIDALANGDVIDPARFSRIFMEKRKSSDHYFFALGQYYEKRLNHQRAAEFYLRAIARRETDTVYRFLVDALWSLGFKEEAVLAARRASELNPNEVGHIIRYSFALMDLGRIDEALELLAEADEERPDNPAILNAIAVGLKLKGELAVAVPSLRRATYEKFMSFPCGDRAQIKELKHRLKETQDLIHELSVKGDAFVAYHEGKMAEIDAFIQSLSAQGEAFVAQHEKQMAETDAFIQALSNQGTKTVKYFEQLTGNLQNEVREKDAIIEWLNTELAAHTFSKVFFSSKLRQYLQQK